MVKCHFFLFSTFLHKFDYCFNKLKLCSNQCKYKITNLKKSPPKKFCRSIAKIHDFFWNLPKCRVFVTTETVAAELFWRMCEKKSTKPCESYPRFVEKIANKGHWLHLTLMIQSLPSSRSKEMSKSRLQINKPNYQIF